MKLLILISILVLTTILVFTLAACEATTTSEQQTPGLTNDERAVIVFVQDHIDDLDAQYMTLVEIAESFANGDGDVDAIKSFGSDYVKLKKQWNDIPVANGRVRRLERQFDRALNDLEDMFKGLYTIIDGGPVKPAYDALERYEKHYDATIEELHDLTTP